MATIQRIAKNTGVLLLAQLISYIFMFFYSAYTARYLGSEGFGTLSFAFALTGILGILADLGLNQITVRELAIDKTLINKYIGNISFLKIILAIFTILLTFLIINLFDYTKETVYVVYIIALATVISAFTQFYYSVFQSYEKMDYQSIGIIINSSLLLLGVYFGIIYGFKVLGFAILYFIANVIVLIYILIVFNNKFNYPKLSFNISFLKRIFKEALPFGVTGIFVTLYYWIDSVMLSLMQNNEVVGFYNAAYRIVLVFVSIQAVYMISIFPVMSNLFKESESTLKLVYERSLKYMLIITIPIAIIVTIFANNIIILVYGSEYIPSIIALQILIWTIIFMFINGLSGNLLGSINMQTSVTKVTLVGVILNVALNFLVIPKYSYIGSSIATVFTEFLILILLIYIISKINYFNNYSGLKNTLKIVICNLTIVIISYLQINLVLSIFLMIFTYIGALLFSKVIDSKDILILKNFLGKQI